MFEHVMAGMARLETRMDEYYRRPPSRHTLRPEPEPPHSREPPRSLEAPLPFTPPFSAASVVTPPLPATTTCSGRFEGFRPNPNSASGSLRPGFSQQQSSWDLPPTSREHRELAIQDDIKTFVEENVVCYEDFAVLITSLFDRNIGATQINSKSSRSYIMFTGKPRASKTALVLIQQPSEQ
ncbi:hypothetical protein SASPL_102378 [Salvia splendens]|uniref:Uncharacterized protein n=1 Tax=Salvia splendens TaxID=180675 RepID=A0A8X8YW61_SALSN|nr:hypothetical protein SASPL_102378 [Salvia splendens]